MNSILFWMVVLQAGLLALPSGLRVVHGDAAMQSTDVVLRIEASEQAIVEWEEFSSNREETIFFIQPNSDSVILNRVTGPNPSELLGCLKANGKVILLNPQGVFFGKESSVDTGGLIAATYNAIDSEFIQNRKLALAGNSTKAIKSEGRIRAGEVCFSSYAIEHSGTIEASRYAGLIAGIVSIDKGEITALCHREIGPREMASVIVRGEIYSPKITLLGDFSAVLGSAVLDASKEGGGGQIHIGGGLIGEEAKWFNSFQTHVESGVSISANALGWGDGGEVVLWSSEGTLFYGSISARGGEMGGNGGFAEVSGPYLEYRGISDLLAPLGKAGTLLLDPTDVNINGMATSVGVILGSPTTLPALAAVNILNNDLNTALGLGNVTINTALGAGLASGTITVAAGFPVSWMAGTFLSLIADQDIFINDTVTASGAGGAISLTAGRDIGVNADVYNNESATMTGAAVSASAGRNMAVTAVNSPVVFGALFGDVSVQACGNLAITGGSMSSATAIIGSRGASTSAGAVGSRGEIAVNVGGNLFIQSGSGPIDDVSAGISRKNSNVDTNSEGNIVVNVRGNITLSSGDLTEFSLTSSCACIGVMNSTAIPNMTRYVGNTTVNAGGTITLATNGVLTTSARSYIGGLGNFQVFNSIITVNTGQDLILQGRILPPSMGTDPAWGQAAHIGNSPLSANRDNLSIYINVGRDLYLDARRASSTQINADNENTSLASYPPELFIHVGGNIVLLAGNRPSNGDGRASIVYQSSPAETFSTQIWAGGNIVCLNSLTQDATLNATPTVGFANIGSMSVLAGGDIINGGGISQQFFSSDNGTLFYQSDYPFSSGDLWSPLSVVVCGSDIFSGTPRGSSSGSISTSTPFATGDDGLGSILFDTASYNNDTFNAVTLTSAQLAAGASPLSFAIFGGVSLLGQGAFNNGSTANFNLGFGGSETSFTSTTGNIVIEGFHDIALTGIAMFSPAVDAVAGNVLLLAQNNISLSNNGAIRSGINTILVSDNEFPTSPLYGSGGILIDSTAQINYGGALRLFTVFPSQNGIDPLALFNGLTIGQIAASYGLSLPGILFQDTLLETYCTYYNSADPFSGSIIGGNPFTIFYKPCFQLAAQEAEMIVTQFLLGFHPFNEFPGWSAIFYFYYRFPEESTLNSSSNLQERGHMLRRRKLKVINHPKSYTVTNIFFGR